MKLSDLIIEHGPYDAAEHPRYGSQSYSYTGAQLNELREELIAARKASEERERFEVAGIVTFGPTLSVRCACRHWSAHIDRPLTLDELNRRAGEHAEVCR